MEMNGAKVLVATAGTNGVTLASIIIRCGIRKLRLILLMLLLNRCRVRRCLGLSRFLAVMDVLDYTCCALVYLNLAPTHGVWYDVLSSLLAILQARDLCWRLASSLSHSLNGGDHLLVILSPWSRLISPLTLRLIDLELQDSVIRPSPTPVWAPTNRPISLVVERGFSGGLMRHFGLGALWWVNSAVNRCTIDRTMGGVLITNLQFLEALIHVRTLSVLSAVVLATLF